VKLLDLPELIIFAGVGRESVHSPGKVGSGPEWASTGGILMNVIKCHVLLTMVAVLFLAPGLLTGCSPKPRMSESVLDTPEHHVSSGFKLLNKSYLFHAKREFELALQLDPNYSDAHRGLGLIYGMEKRFEPALESMRRARDTAETKRQMAMTYVGFMRLYTMEQGDRWLDMVTARFSDALQCQENLPEAYFYMGIAYKQANRPSEAATAFKKVLKINNGLVMESENELKSLPSSK
jgi:Tfp pilus assembly protein PilF